MSRWNTLILGLLAGLGLVADSAEAAEIHVSTDAELQALADGAIDAIVDAITTT